MLANGRVMGPYTTEAVLKLISQGALSGSEKIKKQTGGGWIPITKEADFYDRLLEALHEKTPASIPVEQVIQDTVIAPLPEDALVPPLDPNLQPTPPMKGNFEETQILPARQDSQGARESDDRAPKELDWGNLQKKRNEVLEMQDLAPIVRKNRYRQMRVPFLILSLALIAFVATLYLEEPDEGEKIHLVMPRFGAASAGGDFKKEQQRALAAFQRDTFEGYQEAEGILASILEKSSTHLEARGLLCLTYRELWPFSYQDSSDIDTFNNVVKSTKALDSFGLVGSYCEIARMLNFGKYQDAKGMLDYLLNQQRTSDPILISLKAEVLALEGDPASGAVFADSVRSLWPTWVKPAVMKAEYLMKAKQFQEAVVAYEQALKMSPRHKNALIQYGILNYRYLKKPDQALSILTGVLKSPGRMLRQNEAKASFAVGQIFLDQKQSAKAKAFVERAYELNPGDGEYKSTLMKLGGSTTLSVRAHKHNDLVFLGDQYFRAGDCLAAQAEYKAAFELDSSNAVAAVKAARCLWMLNQSSEAINWLGRAMKADPKLTEAYTLQADYYTQRYNYAQALQVLNRAAALFPNHNEVLRGYGQLEFRRNNMKDAIGFLQRAHRKFDGDLETALLLAKAHAAIGEYKTAESFALRAMELDSTNNEAIVVYAKNLVQFKGLDSGLNYIRDQIKKFSYTIEFRLALAEIYREIERFRDAQVVYEQIIEVDPKNKKAFLGAGESYQAQGVFDRALRSYLSAAVLDPWDAEPLFRAGLLYIDMNRYADAITQFQRALKVNPYFPRGNFYAGKAAFLSGDYAAALTAATEERKINPNLADSYLLAADVYAAQKDFIKCANEYQYAVKLRPQGAEIYVKMARCYRQSGSPDIADSMLNIAATIESGLPDIYKEQGAVYESRGDARSAHAAYSKYLMLSPNAPDRGQIEQRINSLEK